MSIPLILSYNIKYVVFPEGWPYIMLYTWGLLSVIIVPILLLAECLIIIRILTSQYIVRGRPSFIWHILAITIALISELIFLMVKYDLL